MTDVQLSKTLSYLLRHGANQAGLTMAADGSVSVADLLALPQLQRYSEADVRCVVAANDKQRCAGGEDTIQTQTILSLSAASILLRC